jgi:8-oxo-dGTP diphosphatase
MARTLVMAAGGIVLQRSDPPLVAVVRLRKRNEWVLPKGKLNDGETARAAAEREVLEETGHQVIMHEFLGMLAYDAGGRSKVVHFWRMEAKGSEPTHELMSDVRAVAWLPLEEAVERLTRGYEQAFLAQVGPAALESAAAAARPTLAERRRATRRAIDKGAKRAVVAEPPPADAPILLPPCEEIPAERGPLEVESAGAELQPEPQKLAETEAPTLAPQTCSSNTSSEQPAEPAPNLLRRIRRWFSPKS